MEYKFLKITDEFYPKKLKDIKNPPRKLYYIGNINLLEKPMFAVIGTRHITDYGREIAKIFTNNLAEEFVIISGMAIGTDAVAHKAALEAGGKTIAVLGSGFNNIFPKENIELFNEIIKTGGLILTEYSPSVKPKSQNFPARNRIVSGLSDGVLVIEAAYRSGTSITVSFAKEQGKKVFAIPGRLDSKYGVGVNKLIQEGAILVTEIEDIIKHYPQIMSKRWKTIYQEREIKEEYKQIYNILEEGPSGLEELVIKIENRTIREIMNILSKMELEGIIKQEIGVGYKKI